MTGQRSSQERRRCEASPSHPKLDSDGFDVHLAAPGSLKGAGIRVRFERLVDACTQYAFAPSVEIEHVCPIGANHAHNCLLTNSDLKTRVAIARFRTI